MEMKMDFYKEIVCKVTSRKQFTSEKINDCLKILRELGNPGTFHRLSINSFDSAKTVNERIPGGEIDFRSRSVTRWSSVEFKRSSFPPATLCFHFAPKLDHLLWSPPFLLYTVHEDYVNKDKDGQSVKRLLEVFRRCITTLDAYFGNAYLGSFERTSPFPSSHPLGSSIPTEDLIEGISWATYFGPELVEYLGKEKLLKTPVHQIETLHNGGILMLLAPNPLTYDNPEILDIQHKVMDYLGLMLYKHNIIIESLKGAKKETKSSR
jgi:hypothetical protein